MVGWPLGKHQRQRHEPDNNQSVASSRISGLLANWSETTTPNDSLKWTGVRAFCKHELANAA